MPLRKELLDEMARARAAENAEAGAVTRRDLTLTALHCVFWCVLGAVVMAIGFHVWAVTARQWALAYGAFYLGLVIGTGGPAFTLLLAYRRGEERGDW